MRRTRCKCRLSLFEQWLFPSPSASPNCLYSGHSICSVNSVSIAYKAFASGTCEIVAAVSISQAAACLG